MANEINKRYGHLTVIAPTNKTYHGIKIYRCRCDCGNEIEVNTNRLHTGHTKSCGCLIHTPKNLVGRRFGRLKVIEFAYHNNKKNYWKC